MKNTFFFLFSFFFFLVVINCENKDKLVEDHYNKGLEYATQGKFDEARYEFESAFKIDTIKIFYENNIRIINDIDNLLLKREAGIHLFKGMVYYEKTDYNKAIEELNKAIKISPNYAISYNKRGLVYHYKNNYKNAIVNYNKAIELNQDLIIAYYNRARAYDESGQKYRALEEYNLFIDKANSKYKRYIQYAQLRIEQLKGLAF